MGAVSTSMLMSWNARRGAKPRQRCIGGSQGLPRGLVACLSQNSDPSPPNSPSDEGCGHPGGRPTQCASYSARAWEFPVSAPDNRRRTRGSAGHSESAGQSTSVDPATVDEPSQERRQCAQTRYAAPSRSPNRGPMGTPRRRVHESEKTATQRRFMLGCSYQRPSIPFWRSEVRPSERRPRHRP